MTEVELVGSTIRVPGFTEDKDVVTKTEGVREDCDGTEVDIGVVAGGLASGRAIEVPFRELINRLDSFTESLKRCS